MLDEYIKSRNPTIQRASTPNTTSKAYKSKYNTRQEKSLSPQRQETPERAVSMLTYHSSAKSINRSSINKKLDMSSKGMDTTNKKSYYQSLFDRMKNTILKQQQNAYSPNQDVSN